MPRSSGTKTGIVILSLTLCVAGAAYFVSACQKGDGSKSDDKASRTVLDPTKEATVTGQGTLAGTLALLPAGSVTSKSSVALAEAAQPDAFTLAEEAGLARSVSKAVKVDVKDASGKSLAELEKPMALTLALDVGVDGANLAEAPTAENICVFLASVTNHTYVWRDKQLTLSDGGMKVTLNSRYLGVFQAFACLGDLGAGFEDASTSGVTEPRPTATPTATPGPVVYQAHCRVNFTEPQNGVTSVCWDYALASVPTEQQLSDMQRDCELRTPEPGTFNETKTCTTTDAAVACSAPGTTPIATVPSFTQYWWVQVGSGGATMASQNCVTGLGGTVVPVH